MRWMSVLMGLALIAAPARSDLILDESPDAAIERAQAECAAWENGELALEDGLATEVDLTGDGVPETVLDESRFSCSTAASLWCGTGGCMIRIFGGGEPYARLAKGWRTVEWGGDTILMLQVHGSECGGDNTRRCYEALSYSDGAFRSVRALPAD